MADAAVLRRGRLEAHRRGYDRIEATSRRRWVAIPSWGRDGWDLGSWPLAVISHRHTPEGYELAENVEGDATVYRYPTKELRDAATDQLAFWRRKHNEEEWVEGVASIEQAARAVLLEPAGARWVLTRPLCRRRIGANRTY